MTAEPPATLDGRVVRTKERVLQETYRLMIEGGLSGISVDEVSRRSGVAKTTIYRHWPTRSALVLDACSKLGGPDASPDSGTLADDLSILLGRVADQLNNEAWPSVLPSIIDAAERDPEIAGLHANLHAGHMQPFLAAIAAAKRRGELPEGASAETMVATIVGPLFYRRWFSKEPIDAAFVAEIVKRARP